MTCALQASADLYTPALLDYVMYGVPATILGTFCAFPVVKHINVETFRRVLMAVIVLAGVVCLGRSLL